MALRGLDFSRSNQAFARFNQFLQYDLLDQMRTDRDVAVLQISDKLQKERQAEAGNIEAGLARFKSALSDKESYTKAMLDIAKMPEYDHLVAMAHLATDPNLPEEYHEKARAAAVKYAELIKPLAMMAYKASRGLASWEDYEAAIMGGGTTMLKSGMEESGRNWRAQLGADVDREKIGAEREKTGAASADETTKRYIELLKTSISHLESQGVKGTSMTGDIRIFMENKTLNPLDPANQDKALTGLVDLYQRVIDQGASALTPGNKTFIQRVWSAGAWKAAVPTDGGAAGSPAAPGAQAPTRGGGGVDLETGSTSQEEQQAYDAIRRTLIEQKVQEFINAVYGQGTPATPEIMLEARKNATEYVDTQLMPSIRKK